MTLEPIIETLERWTELLQKIAEIELDTEAEPSVIQENLSKRQKLIDEIQSFDASLQNIAALRRQGWPGVDRDTAAWAESLVDLGVKIARERENSDKQIIEIAKVKRRDILEKLRKSNLTKGYGKASERLLDRPPAIVDDNA